MRRPRQAEPPAAPQRALARVGLWGAPQSGKTTFLAALNVATLNSAANWRLVGADDDATDFLAEHSHRLVDEREFPVATQDLKTLSWSLLGTEPGPRRRFGGPGEDVSVELAVDLVDAQGKLYGDRETARPPEADTGELFEDDDADDDDSDDEGVEEQLLSHLVDCHAIVYLFDPVREAAAGDAFRFFERMLLRMAQRVYQQRRLLGSYLPHHLAVCVTKFDEPEVFKKARRGGFVITDVESEAMLPKVMDGRAEEFFHYLCGNGPGNTKLVVRGIEKYFHPDRVGYFVTSAIGFWIGPTGRFQYSDYKNVIKQPDGQSRVRGTIRPINVLEPLLWLERQVRATPASR